MFRKALQWSGYCTSRTMSLSQVPWSDKSTWDRYLFSVPHFLLKVNRRDYSLGSNRSPVQSFLLAVVRTYWFLLLINYYIYQKCLNIVSIYRGKANFHLSLGFTIVRFNTMLLHCVRINFYSMRVSEDSPRHIKLKSEQENMKPSTSCFCHLLLKWLHEEVITLGIFQVDWPQKVVLQIACYKVINWETPHSAFHKILGKVIKKHPGN